MLSSLGFFVQQQHHADLVKGAGLPEGAADSIFEDLTRCWVLFRV